MPGDRARSSGEPSQKTSRSRPSPIGDAHDARRANAAKRAGDGTATDHHRLRQTLQELQPLGLTCPLVNVDRLKKQVQFLVRKKLVTALPASPVGKLRSLVPLRTAGVGPTAVLHSWAGRARRRLPAAGTRAGRMAGRSMGFRP